MNVTDCLKTRRSIRRFKAEPVDHSIIDSVVSSASYSPSWKNTQITRYTAVESQSLLTEIAEKYVPDFNAKIIRQAPVLMAVSYVRGRCGYERDGSFSTKKEDRWQMFDAGIACQSFCLSAWDHGLGTVIMGIFDEDGDLVAVGPHDEMHKPLISTGQAAEFLERFHLPSANATFVEIKITSQALATQQYVESKISEHDADAEAHETLARKSVQIKAGTGLMGGGTLEADRTLTVSYGTAAGTACQGNDARVTASEAFRLSMIGVPRYWRSTTLPAGHVWANGDLALFADWPELKKIYDAGGFVGMLLAYNANSATIAANLGKWRPNAANPTGLYVPNLSEQFFRGWTGGSRTAGSAQEDAIPQHRR